MVNIYVLCYFRCTVTILFYVRHLFDFSRKTEGKTWGLEPTLFPPTIKNSMARINYFPPNCLTHNNRTI